VSVDLEVADWPYKPQSDSQDWEHVTNISQGTAGGHESAHAQVNHSLCKLIPVMVGQTKECTIGWMIALSCKLCNLRTQKFLCKDRKDHPHSTYRFSSWLVEKTQVVRQISMLWTWYD
jgi:hypothetical protein